MIQQKEPATVKPLIDPASDELLDTIAEWIVDIALNS